MKNCSRSKLFVCFKPIDIDPDDQIIDCVAVSKMMSRNSSSTTLSDKKMSLRRSFSAVFKSTLYQTSLSKRVRDIQRSKSLCQLLNSDLYKQSSTTNKNRNHKSGSSTTPALITGGSTSPSSSFGSSDISETDNLRSCSGDDDHEVEEVAKNNGRKKEGTIKRSVGRRRKGLSLNHVIYLVGVSLLVTVLWGKFLAVVITTVWIFFAPVFLRGLSLEKCTSTRLRFLLSNLSRS